MKLITAVDENWAIGKDNDLVFHLKKDLAFFKKTTLNQTVIMGERTFYSLPFINGQCLPNRKKVVMSNNSGLIMKYDDWSDITFAQTVDSDFLVQHKDAFIIGGAYTYECFMPYVDTMYLTHIHAAAEEADTYFSEACRPDNTWQQEIIEEGEEDGIAYSIVKYTREKPLRVVKRYIGNGQFETIRLQELRKGDLFKLYEPCGKIPVIDKEGCVLFEAESDGEIINGVGTISCKGVREE